MKKIFLALAFFGLAKTATAQVTVDEPVNNGYVESYMFNVQAGTFGAWVNGEWALSKHVALRAEVGLDLWFYDTFWTDESGSVLAPSLNVEPRWYYNIEKRARKGKHTNNNSANFLGLAVRYYPDLFVIGSAPDYIHIPDQMSFIPKWGMRRSIAQSNFNYELGLGIGYIWMLKDDDVIKSSTDNLGVDLHIRIGYTF